VTAYFLVATSKHTPAAFLNRMRTFFEQVGPRVVVFTTPDFVAIMREMRGEHRPPIHFILQETVWNSSWVAPKEANFRTVQRALDFGNAAPELYAVWSSKAGWLATVARENPWRSEFFLWCDIGAQRTPHLDFSPWPDEGRMASVFENHAHRVLLSTVFTFDARWDWRRVWPYRNAMIQGGVFGGSASAVAWYNETYCATFDDLSRRGYFAANEQGVMNIIAIEHTHRVLIVDAASARGPGCSLSSWFYFWAFLAAPGTGDKNCVLVGVHTFEESAATLYPHASSRLLR
jgi:hypothetical protein